MKNKTCPFQDWVLTQGTNSAKNEHDETDPRTCPDWLRMSINKTDAHPQDPASTRTGRVMSPCFAFTGEHGSVVTNPFLLT